MELAECAMAGKAGTAGTRLRAARRPRWTLQAALPLCQQVAKWGMQIWGWKRLYDEEDLVAQCLAVSLVKHRQFNLQRTPRQTAYEKWLQAVCRNHVKELFSASPRRPCPGLDSGRAPSAVTIIADVLGSREARTLLRDALARQETGEEAWWEGRPRGPKAQEVHEETAAPAEAASASDMSDLTPAAGIEWLEGRT